MRKIGLAVLAAVLFWAGAPVPSRADLDDFFSRWRLILTAQEEYTTNVFLTGTEVVRYVNGGKAQYHTAAKKVDNFITTLSPQLSFSTLPKSAQAGAFNPLAAARETPYGAILDFKPGFVFYGTRSTPEGKLDNYVSLDGNLNAWYNLGRVLTFRVREYILRSQEPREQDSAYDALTGQYYPGADQGRITYLRNIVEPAVDYRFGGPDDLVSLAYQHNAYCTNRVIGGDDSRTHSLLPRFTWWIDRRNGLSLDGQVQMTRYESAPDLTGYQVTGRYTWRLDPLTSFYGENTVAWRYYSSVSRRPPKPPIFPPVDLNARSNDYTLESPSIGGSHAFSPTLSGSLQVGGYFQNPGHGSGNSGPTYKATLTNRSEQLTLGLLLQGGYNEDFSSSENLGFMKYHRVVVNVGYNFTSRLSAGLSPSYEFSRSMDDVKQNRWELSLNSTYKILKWLDLTASATYRDNQTNDDLRDYNEFRALVKLTATF
jgi:hypothetical protein